ncbi:MAG: TetR/AcrR family transcriptional regulator [Catenulisporales bacterium]|nr:TetR/AcrR family transcriptional regulator [Catenulisporales bacterium]
MTSSPRTRRRGAALEDAILDAAWEELAQVGHDRVTMGAVAERAGTSKAVLYRRWPNRGGLLAAAIARRVTPLNAGPIETGDLRTDLLELLRTLKQRCDSVAAGPEPDGGLAASVRRRAARDGFESMTLILDRARQRGQISEAPDDHIVRLPIALLYGELSLAETPVPDRLIEAIVDEIFLPLVSRYS